MGRGDDRGSDAVPVSDDRVQRRRRGAVLARRALGGVHVERVGPAGSVCGIVSSSAQQVAGVNRRRPASPLEGGRARDLLLRGGQQPRDGRRGHERWRGVSHRNGAAALQCATCRGSQILGCIPRWPALPCQHRAGDTGRGAADTARQLAGAPRAGALTCGRPTSPRPRARCRTPRPSIYRGGRALRVRSASSAPACIDSSCPRARAANT